VEEKDTIAIPVEYHYKTQSFGISPEFTCCSWVYWHGWILQHLL